MAATDYDRTEAEDILIEAASRLSKNRRARVDAAVPLVDALLKMEGFGGARFVVDHGTPKTGMQIDVQIEHKAVSVTFNPADAVFKVNGQPVELRYNIITDCFEGGPDQFYTPEPGKPPRRRAALAVIIEAVVAAMG